VRSVYVKFSRFKSTQLIIIKMDKSLDDIIAEKRSKNPAPRRGAGGARRGNRRGSTNSAPRRSNGGVPSGPWRHDMFSAGGASRNAPKPLMGIPTGGIHKLIISNLDYGVTDNDIRELFGEFGSMDSACIHFDSNGCSLGSAQVIYTNRAAAIKAKQQYDGVHLDRRPMKISLDGSGGFGGGLLGRPTPVKRLSGAYGGGRQQSGGGRGGQGRGGARGGRGGRGGSSGGSRNEKPKSAEELDKELDTYLAASKRK